MVVAVPAVAIKTPGRGILLLPVFYRDGKQQIVNKLDRVNKLLATEKYSKPMMLLNVDIERYFENIEIESDYLKILFFKTILKIIHSGFRQDLFFGSVIEGCTIAGGDAEVTGDHCIRINSDRLKKYKDNVATALLAHELAHAHLKHYRDWKNNLENEHGADNLARQWGFDIDEFRRICGPPAINSRLQQISQRLRT